MSRRPFSGREVATVLVEWGFEPVGGSGSHRKFRYEHPTTGEVRVVVVPMHDELETGTLRQIAEQAGATHFQAFCRELDRRL